MRTIIFTIMVVSVFFACKNTKEEQPYIHDTIEISETTARKMNYPVPLRAVMKAHGSYDRWSLMNNLCFAVDRDSGTEIHTASLPDRRHHIQTDDWTIGSDNGVVWLLENEEGAYTGNARFYHNLMFYFYGMPFIIGDDGIEYEEIKARELDGEVYEGIKISYKAGVGDSPEDEYILFYHPETHQMTWLGYTVTFETNEKNDAWRYIKYNKWQDVNGLKLPEELVWYNVEDNKPVSPRTTLTFSKVTVTETVLDDAVFQKPGNATIVKR